MSIAIIDYGMANLRSVHNALTQVGIDSTIISKAAQTSSHSHLILPGVGAFKDAVATLRAGGWDQVIQTHIAHGRPLLGICLGLQMLFDVGYEDGEHKGLGILAGDCVRFNVDKTLGLKVPHMGWNQIKLLRPCPLFNDIPPGAGVYFVHSYFVRPKDPSIIATTTDYGGEFVSSIWKDNIIATQFHPEKSQAVGLKILENFARV